MTSSFNQKMPTDIKIVCVGDGDSGKTSMILSYCTNSFIDSDIPTVWDHFRQDVKVDGETVSLQLWDVSGVDTYKKLRPMAYPETDVFIVCFNLARRESLENVKHEWVPEIRHHKPTTPIILVGTKSDLRQDPNIKAKNKVSHSEGKKLAKSIGAKAYVECSARTLENVKDAFDEAIYAAL